jgi:hypothetical protein
MRKAYILMVIFSVICSASVAFADRPLEREEILHIFKVLTNQPQKTWLPTCSIKASHQEYKAAKTTDAAEIGSKIQQSIAEYLNNPNKPELTESLQKMHLDAIPFNVRYELSNEYTMDSSVVVKFDGQKFYWEIVAGSRNDSVQHDRSMEGNFMSKKFDLNSNAKRIFAWDGEKYTTYFLPSNHAIVDAKGNTPHIVNGPLTAGIIPWGYGSYTYQALADSNSTAVETFSNSSKQIHLTLNYPSGQKIILVLDSQRNYSLVSCSKTGLANISVSNQYSNYKLISGQWMPTSILLENYETSTKRLTYRERWNFTEIDPNIPQSFDFDVVFQDDAMIEYFAPISGESQLYRYSYITNTDSLLADRLEYLVENQSKNCATAAVKYAAAKSGKSVSLQQLSRLVDAQTGQTNLYQMKQFLISLGLNCKVVRTDIQSLRDLSGCQAIMHIPGKKHFVVLDRIDSENVWTIDLSNNKFFYRTDISFFGLDWTEGEALLVSNQPIQPAQTMIEITDDQLNSIVGAAGYSCTKLLQNYNVISCVNYENGCQDLYKIFFTRYGCEASLSGSCTNSLFIRYKTSPCINDPYDPFICYPTGEWTLYNMRACS